MERTMDRWDLEYLMFRREQAILTASDSRRERRERALEARVLASIEATIRGLIGAAEVAEGE